MKLKEWGLFSGLILLTVFLRFYQLGSLPEGLSLDEASQGYNAFSLINTGKDRYGENFPILFRSFGSFQAPLYTYLTIMPVFLFGNTIFSIHFISAFCGVLLVIITFVFLRGYKSKNENSLAFIAGFLMCISPWNVLFSRYGTEAILAAALFAASVLFFYLGIKRNIYFIPAFIFIGLSTHAYYSEKIISLLFLCFFSFIFRKEIFRKKTMFITGFVLFIVIMLPHLFIMATGSFTRRADQVSYLSQNFFENNSGDLKTAPFGKSIFIIRQFLSHYMAYLSPKNLFFDPDPQSARSIPDLSVFYNWMAVPLIAGILFLMRNFRTNINKMLLILLFTSLIPAALTREPFYTLRILVFLWCVTLIISYGVWDLLEKIRSVKLKYSLFSIFLILSLVHFYISYFVLFKYERGENFGYGSIQLLKRIDGIQDRKVVIDTSMDLGLGIRYAYLKIYDPRKIQKILSQEIKDKYYSGNEYSETYNLDNIEIRPVMWNEDIYKDQILISDNLAISKGQAKEHSLDFLFDVKDIAGNVAFVGYQTNPRMKCASEKNTNVKCL